MSTKSVVVIGGGIAGMEVTNQLAAMGFDVYLLEKSNRLGGKLLDWDRLFPTFRKAGEVVQYMSRSKSHAAVHVFTDTMVKNVEKKDGLYIVYTSSDQILRANALVITTGFELFNAARKEEYGYGIYDNVFTSADLERKLGSGEALINAQGIVPRRIAFVHCVGSRDVKTGNHYCSKVCCITGVKQAIEVKQQIPGAEIYCFYMDLRMYGEGYEELYRKAQEKYYVQFIRGRVSEVSENIDHSLLLKAEDTLSGRPLKMNVDMLVLLIGMEPGRGSNDLKQLLKLETMQSGFPEPADVHVSRNITSVRGVFMAGACICPLSVNDTIENARSAALEVQSYLQNN